MNCESGKTYYKAGTCPVCKMDLKANKSETSMNCAMHKDGNCSCKADKHGEHKSSEKGEKLLVPCIKSENAIAKVMPVAVKTAQNTLK
jgi:hypothetical protein